MTQYFHAHKVLLEQCRGHMSCMRHCPTQAIRVRWGKAFISDELCVDCGTCISTCPSNAIIPVSDSLADISHFKYKVVVPSPVLYSQFEPGIHPYIIT
jgi:Fe-S-cluster-containing hydrogenase component 2